MAAVVVVVGGGGAVARGNSYYWQAGWRSPIIGPSLTSFVSLRSFYRSSYDDDVDDHLPAACVMRGGWRDDLVTYHHHSLHHVVDAEDEDERLLVATPPPPPPVGDGGGDPLSVDVAAAVEDASATMACTERCSGCPGLSYMLAPEVRHTYRRVGVNRIKKPPEMTAAFVVCGGRTLWIAAPPSCRSGVKLRWWVRAAAVVGLTG